MALNPTGIACHRRRRVVKRLREAGAVLVAKVELGALALNDIWFGGQTMNPWCWRKDRQARAQARCRHRGGPSRLRDGSETAAALSAPACVAGLPVSVPLRPRAAHRRMTLCWSLDKLGPMTRSVEDAMLVLQAISGPTPEMCPAWSSRLDYDAAAPVQGLRVGYFPRWMEEIPLPAWTAPPSKP